MKKSKKSNKNHLSIQICFRLPNDFKSYLHKSIDISKADAVKACIIKAKELCDQYKEFEPWKVSIIDQLTTEKHYEYARQIESLKD